MSDENLNQSQDAFEAALTSSAVSEEATTEAAVAEVETPAEEDPNAEFRRALENAPGEWFVVHSYAGYEKKVKANLQNLLSQAIGTEMVLVHQKDPSNVLVKKVGRSNTVSISNLSPTSYVYPEPNVRKYANIKVNATINGGTYVVNFQFRGTTAADKGPKYLRILLERM